MTKAIQIRMEKKNMMTRDDVEEGYNLTEDDGV